MIFPRPHDLLWVTHRQDLDCADLSWLEACWDPSLPLVVRRDNDGSGRIAVGVRGERRDQRAAGWIDPAAIVRRVTPEQLVAQAQDQSLPFSQLAPLRAARILASRSWPWGWGITGSTGFALATGREVLHADSDLDLTIRAPQALSRERLAEWQDCISQLPCRADTQVETPQGAFALNEWLRGGAVLLKTNGGPNLTHSPWLSQGGDK